MPLSEENFYQCPYCGSENSILIDFTGGASQQFVTDCEICCRPISIRLELDGETVLSFYADTE